MQSSHQKKKMKKALYLILAGVAIGLLVAPDKGSETRRKLKAGFDEWKEDAMDQIDELVSQGQDLISKGKNLVSKGKNEAKEAVNSY